GVGQADAELRQPPGMLVGLVGEGVPDHPVAGRRPGRWWRDVGMWPPAGAGQVPQARQEAAEGGLRPILPPEALVVGKVEAAPKGPGLPGAPVGGEEAVLVFPAEEGQAAEVAAALGD